jgi:hypothetical protein
MTAMHEIDYKVFGDDMQFVEVELDPQEAAPSSGMVPNRPRACLDRCWARGSACSQASRSS